MEERYWLRHPSLNGHLGPYAKEDLAQSFENESFPKDSYVLLDRGQNLQDRQTSVDWFPLRRLLGLAEPPKASYAPPALPSNEPPKPPDASERRDHLRRCSAYSALRTLIIIAQLILLVGTLVVSFATAQRGAGGVAMVAWFIQAVMIVAGGMLLQALLDIADHAVWTTPHPHDRDGKVS